MSIPHAYLQISESHVSHVIEHLEIKHVLTNKTNKLKGKTVCALKRNCVNCYSSLDPQNKHECFKPYCTNCRQNREIGHLCYMKPLSNELSRSDNVLFVFYNFETTQDKSFLIQQQFTFQISYAFSTSAHTARCSPIFSVDCERCGKRQHSFFNDPVGDFSYLCKPRPWCQKIVAIAHNARGLDAQFILDRAILLKWNRKLNLN